MNRIFTGKLITLSQPKKILEVSPPPVSKTGDKKIYPRQSEERRITLETDDQEDGKSASEIIEEEIEINELTGYKINEKGYIYAVDNDFLNKF